jgi:hypothetical protein
MPFFIRKGIPWVLQRLKMSLQQQGTVWEFSSQSISANVRLKLVIQEFDSYLLPTSLVLLLLLRWWKLYQYALQHPLLEGLVYVCVHVDEQWDNGGTQRRVQIWLVFKNFLLPLIASVTRVRTFSLYFLHKCSNYWTFASCYYDWGHMKYFAIE